MKEQRRLAGIASGAARRKKAEQLLLNGCSTGVQRVVNENEQKKVKEKKLKEKKEDINEPLTEFEKVIEDFKNHRKQIKSPMTDKAIELLLNKLNKMSSDETIKIAILNQSIENGWKGIFELKTNQLNNTKANDGIIIDRTKREVKTL
jgi:hypothetical protein